MVKQVWKRLPRLPRLLLHVLAALCAGAGSKGVPVPGQAAQAPSSGVSHHHNSGAAGRANVAAAAAPGGDGGVIDGIRLSPVAMRLAQEGPMLSSTPTSKELRGMEDHTGFGGAHSHSAYNGAQVGARMCLSLTEPR